MPNKAMVYTTSAVAIVSLAAAISASVAASKSRKQPAYPASVVSAVCSGAITIGMVAVLFSTRKQ